MSQNKIIGNKIRQLRKLKKMTLENLASRLGISYGYLGQVERGETKANDDIFTGIFREFGVNIADLSGVPAWTAVLGCGKTSFSRAMRDSCPVLAGSLAGSVCRSAWLKKKMPDVAPGESRRVLRVKGSRGGVIAAPCRR